MKASSATGSTSSAVLSVFQMGRPWKTFDPFLFCMHHRDLYPKGNEAMAPDRALLRGRSIGSDFSYKDGWSMYHGDEVPGFPQHPHRGFETITITRQGLVDHADSLGAAGRYGNGDVQWMTAGGGVQHCEMFPLLNRESDNTMELFQVWLNLPKASKMVKAYFTMFWDAQVPRATLPCLRGRAPATVKITAGAPEYFTETPLAVPAPPPESWASSKHDADICVWEITVPAGSSVMLPPARRSHANRTLYLFEGSDCHVGGETGTKLAAGTGARLDATRPVQLEVSEGAGEPAQFLMLQGVPIGEPVVQHGPFVMNTQEEIMQTMRDYQRTQFGGWPWKKADQTHGRETRFAKHSDGRVERPPGSTDSMQLKI